MNHRTLIAIQFAIWAFAFSRIIPFSGEFLVPIVYLFSKRVLLGYAIIEALLALRVLPAAVGMVESLQIATYHWVLNYWVLGPLLAGYLILGVFWMGWFGALFLRRKMRKKAPDLAQML